MVYQPETGICCFDHRVLRLNIGLLMLQMDDDGIEGVYKTEGIYT